MTPSKVERAILIPADLSEPPPIDLATQIKSPRLNPADSTVAISDTSEWARRLAARGGRRDLDAVIETFQESMQCHHYHDAVAYLQVISNSPRKIELTKLNLRDLEELDEDMTRRQTIIDRASALCEGSDRAAVNHAYERAKLEAALRGDPDAQTCFLKMGIDGRYLSPLEYQHVVGPRYAEYHRSFTEAGLERADPYVGFSTLADYLRATGPDPLPSSTSEPLPDIVRVWEVARLASLRAPPYLRSMTEDMLRSAAARALISPEDIARADAWAQATWENQFADEPPFDFGRYGACSPHGWH
ncbi:MAG TPA: hypothetical protein VFN29_09175 [Chiayiivirga sp.]|nr:hypothetical protein [Chiayiivirga sp.]